MKWRFWKRRINFSMMAGWWFTSIPSIWTSCASCSNCQSDCRTNVLLVTVKLRLQTTQRNWNPHDASTYRSCVWDSVVSFSRSTTVPICDPIPLNLCIEAHTERRWLFWNIWLATWQVMLTNMSLWSGKACIQVFYVTMSVKSLCLRFSAMQTGLLIETPEDQSLVVQSSMEDVLFTLPRGLKRSCHSRAPSLKHMLPLQLSWMPSLIRTILCWVLQVRILMYLYLDSSAARGVLSRKGVGRLRHLSCRVLWLQNLGRWKGASSQGSFGNNQSSWCVDQATVNSKAGIIDVSVWTLEHNSASTRRSRRFPAEFSGTFNKALHPIQVEIHNFEFWLAPWAYWRSSYRGVKPWPTTWWRYRMSSLQHGLVCLACTSSGCRSAPRATGATRDRPQVLDAIFQMMDDDVDTASVASCMTEGTDEPPAFSPEGLIEWLFERCNRRVRGCIDLWEWGKGTSLWTTSSPCWLTSWTLWGPQMIQKESRRLRCWTP